jgi:hypothetical protein
MARRGSYSSSLSDRELLEKFDTVFQEMLATSRFLATTPGASLSVSFNRVKGMEIRINELDENDLKAYLTDFRKFTLSNDDLNLFRIFRILDQSLTNDDLRQQLRLARQDWKDKLTKGGIKMTFNDVDLTPEYVIDLLINGWVFHSDHQAWVKFREPWGNPITKFQVNNVIVDGTRVLLFRGHAVRIALRDNLLAI